MSYSRQPFTRVYYLGFNQFKNLRYLNLKETGMPDNFELKSILRKLKCLM